MHSCVDTFTKWILFSLIHLLHQHCLSLTLALRAWNQWQPLKFVVYIWGCTIENCNIELCWCWHSNYITYYCLLNGSHGYANNFATNVNFRHKFHNQKVITTLVWFKIFVHSLLSIEKPIFEYFSSLVERFRRVLNLSAKKTAKWTEVKDVSILYILIKKFT